MPSTVVPRLLGVAIGLAVMLAPCPPTAWAAESTVTTTEDELATNGRCSLREAIRSANVDAAVHPDCPAGTGADTIRLPAGTYRLTIPGAGEDAAATGDLDITETVTILGAGAASTCLRRAPQFLE